MALKVYEKDIVIFINFIFGRKQLMIKQKGVTCEKEMHFFGWILPAILPLKLFKGHLIETFNTLASSYSSINKLNYATFMIKYILFDIKKSMVSDFGQRGFLNFCRRLDKNFFFFFFKC